MKPRWGLDVLAPLLTAITIVALAVLILLAVNTIKAGNRAIACVLSVDPTTRTDQAVGACFTDQGLTPP